MAEERGLAPAGVPRFEDVQPEELGQGDRSGHGSPDDHRAEHERAVDRDRHDVTKAFAVRQWIDDGGIACDRSVRQREPPTQRIDVDLRRAHELRGDIRARFVADHEQAIRFEAKAHLRTDDAQALVVLNEADRSLIAVGVVRDQHEVADRQLLIGELLGDAYVERVNQTTYRDPIMRTFIDHATEHVFGALWARPGLDLKTRALVCVVSDAATGRDPELAIHLRMARRQGWTEAELIEVLLHLSGYVGVPIIREAMLSWWGGLR